MLKQSLQQKLLQKLSPQQIQLMKLLQVPTLELEARIKQELEANPALEEGVEQGPEADDFDEREESSEAMEDFDFQEYLDDETPDYQLSIRNHGADVEDKHIPLGSGQTFRELLVDQLALLDVPEDIRRFGEHLIGHLEDDGYLRRELESIVNDLAFTQGIEVELETLQDALAVVQTLDPPGVGARDLKECLLLQVVRKQHEKEADDPLVTLTVKGTNGDLDTAAVETELQELSGIRSVTAQTGTNGLVTAEIQADTGMDIRPMLSTAATANNWTLYELKRDALDLEGIFRKLTQEA